AAEFLKKSQARAAAEGADPLGYYLGGWGNAYISVLGEAVSGAKSTVDDKVADYLRNHEFKTIMGSWRYGTNGEWTKSGFLEVQYHNIKEGAGLETEFESHMPSHAVGSLRRSGTRDGAGRRLRCLTQKRADRERPARL